MSDLKNLRIVVVGGGITGLSAAFYLQSMLDTSDTGAELFVAEKESSFGGKIKTLLRDGCVIERGPDSFLARKRPMLDLTRELDLVEHLRATNPHANKTYILHEGEFHRMPPGLMMGIPTRWKPLVETKLLSTPGKLRAIMDLVLPRKNDEADESLGSFLSRRLGTEVTRNITEPLLSGIYAGDPSELSVKATFPQFWELERRHRSLILGMVNSRKKDQTGALDHVPEHLRRSVFLTYQQGLGTVVQALEQRLQEAGVELLRNRQLVSLDKRDDAYELHWQDGTSMQADAVILAIPAFAIAPLFPQLEAVQSFCSMPYASVANVVFAFDRQSLSMQLDATGFLVPRKEKRAITACTWTSMKWEHTAPDNIVLMRCYIGRTHEEQWMEMGDEALIQLAYDEMSKLMGVTAKPLFTEVTRWPQSMPQYTTGHLDRIREARKQLAQEMPRIWMTGAAFHGVGIPDCVRQGKEAAEQLFAALSVR